MGTPMTPGGSLSFSPLMSSRQNDLSGSMQVRRGESMFFAGPVRHHVATPLRMRPPLSPQVGALSRSASREPSPQPMPRASSSTPLVVQRSDAPIVGNRVVPAPVKVVPVERLVNTVAGVPVPVSPIRERPASIGVGTKQIGAPVSPFRAAPLSPQPVVPYRNFVSDMARSASSSSPLAGRSTTWTPDVLRKAQIPETPIFGGPPYPGIDESSEFNRLVKSLEDRVDLMAQIQQARAQIQARAKRLEDSCGRAMSPTPKPPPPATQSMSPEPWTVPAMSPEVFGRPFATADNGRVDVCDARLSNLENSPEEAYIMTAEDAQRPLSDEFHRLNHETAHIQQELSRARGQIMALREENESLLKQRMFGDPECPATLSPDQPPIDLAQNNTHLWAQLQEQRAHIADLSNALSGVQELLRHSPADLKPFAVDNVAGFGAAFEPYPADAISTTQETVNLGQIAPINAINATSPSSTVNLGLAESPATVATDFTQLPETTGSPTENEVQKLVHDLNRQRQQAQAHERDVIAEAADKMWIEVGSGILHGAHSLRSSSSSANEHRGYITHTPPEVAGNQVKYVAHAPPDLVKPSTGSNDEARSNGFLTEHITSSWNKDMKSAEIDTLKSELTIQTAKLEEMRKRLGRGKEAPTMQNDWCTYADLVQTAAEEAHTVPHSLPHSLSEIPTLPPTASDIVTIPSNPDLWAGPMPPFSHSKRGINISISDDGYTATRTRGCRQSVVMGSAPLHRCSSGWYFEVEVLETVQGWVGGLGIGVTQPSPEEHLTRMPDKAWRMPRTYMAGYWGRVFINGQELQTSWKAEDLKAGSRVGVLVTAGGDLLVFQDGQQVVWVEAQIVVPDTGGAPLIAVVDVFAATSSVTLCQNAEPPSPPWGIPNTPQAIDSGATI